MASRLNFSTGAIVNPLEGLQQSVATVGSMFDKYVQREQDREDRLAREAEDRRRYEIQLGRYDRQEQESLRRYEEGKELNKLEREEARKWKEKEFGLRETEAQQQKALRDMQIAEAKEVAASKKALREFDSSKIGNIIQDPAVNTLKAREDQIWSSGLEQNKDGTYSQNVTHLADPTTTVDKLKGAISSASVVDKKDATRRLTQYLVNSGVDRATAGTIAAQEVELQDNVADFKALDEAARKQRQEEFKDRLAVTNELGDLITSRSGTNVTVNSDGSKTGLDLLPKTIEHVGKAFEGDDQTYVVKGLTDASLRLSDKFTPKELATGMAMYGNTLHTSGLISGGYGKMKGYEGDVSTGFEQFMAENSDKLRKTAAEDSNGLRNTYLQSLQNLSESLVSRTPSTENQRLAAMRAGMDMPTLRNNEGLMSDSMFGSDQNRLLRGQDADMYGTVPASKTVKPTQTVIPTTASSPIVGTKEATLQELFGENYKNSQGYRDYLDNRGGWLLRSPDIVDGSLGPIRMSRKEVIDRVIPSAVAGARGRLQNQTDVAETAADEVFSRAVADGRSVDEARAMRLEHIRKHILPYLQETHRLQEYIK